MIEAEVPVTSVQKMLGHTSIRTTQLYVNGADRQVENVAQRVNKVCSLRLNDIDMKARKLFIHSSKERKDRIAYMSDTTALALQQHLAIRPDPDAVHLFSTQH